MAGLRLVGQAGPDIRFRGPGHEEHPQLRRRAGPLAGHYGWDLHSATAASASELTTDGSAALERLYAGSERARRYSRDAKAILVFPRIVKAGLVVGGQSGEGVLFVDGQPAGYFRFPPPRSASRPAHRPLATHCS